MAAIEIGYVAKAHGVRGELRVVLHNPSSDTLGRVPRVTIGSASYTVTRVRPVKDAVLLTVDEVRDRDQAELLRGSVVSVERDLIPVAEGELLLADLVGCQAVLESGEVYGVISAVDSGFQDRLVIESGEVERLLPLVPAFVLDIDLGAGRVVVAPPDGLPEEPRRGRGPGR